MFHYISVSFRLIHSIFFSTILMLSPIPFYHLHFPMSLRISFPITFIPRFIHSFKIMLDVISFLHTPATNGFYVGLLRMHWIEHYIQFLLFYFNVFTYVSRFFFSYTQFSFLFLYNFFFCIYLANFTFNVNEARGKTLCQFFFCFFRFFIVKHV